MPIKQSRAPGRTRLLESSRPGYSPSGDLGQARERLGGEAEGSVAQGRPLDEPDGFEEEERAVHGRVVKPGALGQLAGAEGGRGVEGRRSTRIRAAR